jgi:hypothetical protein
MQCHACPDHQHSLTHMNTRAHPYAMTRTLNLSSHTFRLHQVDQIVEEGEEGGAAKQCAVMFTSEQKKAVRACVQECMQMSDVEVISLSVLLAALSRPSTKTTHTALAGNDLEPPVLDAILESLEVCYCIVPYIFALITCMLIVCSCSLHSSFSCD